MDEKKNPNPQANQAQQPQAWAPNTLYHVGDRRKDAPSGGNYKCAVGHTSGSGTMEQDRSAHSDYWTAV